MNKTFRAYLLCHDNEHQAVSHESIRPMLELVKQRVSANGLNSFKRSEDARNKIYKRATSSGDRAL